MSKNIINKSLAIIAAGSVLAAPSVFGTTSNTSVANADTLSSNSTNISETTLQLMGGSLAINGEYLAQVQLYDASFSEATSAEGTVYFYVDGEEVGSTEISNGEAIYNIRGLSNTSKHTIYAKFVSSNDSYTDATSRTVTVSVPYVTKTVLTGSDSALEGSTVNYTVNVGTLYTTDDVTPTGKAQIYVNNEAYGDPVDLVNGEATIPVKIVSGENSIHAQFVTSDITKFIPTSSNIIDFIAESLPTITTENSLKNPVKGITYSNTITATGNPSPTLSITSGSLPKGLTFDNGTISGTPTETGLFNFTVTATSDSGTTTKNYSLYVEEQPSITTNTITDATVDESYNQEITYTGYPKPTLSITSGSLPDGLELQGDDITGTPTTAGTYTFTVTATSSNGTDSKQYTINVNTKPVINTSSFKNGKTGEQYSQNIDITGTPTPTVKISSGTLPDGLSLTNNTISGTPTKSGTYNFTITATSEAGTVSKDYSITIQSTPVITTQTIPGGAQKEPYTATITATGDPKPVLSLSGSLPKGLNFDAKTGVISGTPTTPGTYNFTITAKSDAGTTSKTFTITIQKVQKQENIFVKIIKIVIKFIFNIFHW